MPAKDSNAIELGSTVRDKVTGFRGIVTGIVHYLTGCHQALVQPKIKEDGSWQESHWFDTDRCEILNDKPLSLAVVDPGPDEPAPRR